MATFAYKHPSSREALTSSTVPEEYAMQASAIDWVLFLPFFIPLKLAQLSAAFARYSYPHITVALTTGILNGKN